MSSDKKVTIQPMPNGPYIVEGLESLQNSQGPVEAKPKMALCRCGQSSNKPFCDGTHAKVGFSSEKAADRTPDKRDNYAGAKITVHDNRGICAHAGRCTDGLPAVFRLREEPFVDPDGAGPTEIRDVVRTCPSGALTYTIPGEKTFTSGDQDPSVFIAPNGPYVVSGEPELQNTEFLEGVPKDHFTLCRCGGSKNKPFCDGTHWSNGFTD